ncbi:MAG: TPM domain-containing protein [Bacteroidota bacterium]|nr:TPM domain-containing protein [Bacteroidota bacterium]
MSKLFRLKYLCVRSILFILVFFKIFFLYAQEVPDRPNPPRLVNDFSGILSVDEKNTLEQKLVRFNDSTSNQIAIVIVNDLGGLDKADYAIQIGQKWGIGQKDKNNGIVILVKPIGDKGERKAFIAVGYGLESVIPDAIAKRIVENEMIPHFAKGEYYHGLDAATSVLMSLANKEFSSDQYAKRTKAKETPWFFKLIPLFVIFFIFLLMKASARRRTTIGSNGSSILPFWAALFFMNSMGGGRRSDFNDFSSGSNDFGGFGGGDFGGGGAGGSW